MRRKTHLFLSVDALAGMHLGEAMVEMLDLARRVGCGIELKANDTTLWVYPEDTEEAVRDAFARLYPKSRYVSTHTKEPVPK